MLHMVDGKCTKQLYIKRCQRQDVNDCELVQEEYLKRLIVIENLEECINQTG